LLLQGLGVSHSTGLVVDSDQSSGGVNIRVDTSHIISISGLVVGDVGQLIVVSNLEFIGIVGPGSGGLLDGSYLATS